MPFADTTGSTRTDTLAPGASIHDQTNASLTATGAEGWAQATCTGPVEASLLYRFYSASGTAEGEASVSAETAPTSKFVTFAQSAAASTGVAYANPSTTQSAVITITAYDAAGNTLGNKTVTLGPLQHGASNVNAISASFTWRDCDHFNQPHHQPVIECGSIPRVLVITARRSALAPWAFPNCLPHGGDRGR